MAEHSPSALALNRASFNQILFRPRILVDVDLVDTRTNMLGQDTTLPVRFPFICSGSPD